MTGITEKIDFGVSASGDMAALRREVRALALEKLEIAIIDLRPGDQIIVHPGKPLTDEALAQLSQAVSHIWPEYRPVVMPHGMSIEIVAPVKEPPT